MPINKVNAEEIKTNISHWKGVTLEEILELPDLNESRTRLNVESDLHMLHSNNVNHGKYVYIEGPEVVRTNIRSVDGIYIIVLVNVNDGVIIDIEEWGDEFLLFTTLDNLSERVSQKYSVAFFDELPESAVYVDAEREVVKNITNLKFDISKQSVKFDYDLPNDKNFSHLELHQDGALLADNIISNKFDVTNLEFDTKYTFTFYSIGKNGERSNGVTREITIPENPDLLPSNNIHSLSHNVTDTSVSFTYQLPLDERFSHLKVYRDNELITDEYKLNEYTDRNLNPETEYSYRFVSVNKEGITNNGYEITIKTNIENDNTPPAIPTNLTAKPMNSGIIFNWAMNTESDLKGYNIYLNGKKINSSSVKNNFYNITNLNNDEEYSLTVSSVDTNDNESEKAVPIKAIPTVENLPIFKLDTNLSSVVHSVENWFSEIWLLVAFAVAIPLSFVIGRRVKSLFIA